MKFEEKLNKLEKIVEGMEKGELSLEQALKDFEEGVKLTRECQKELTDAEQKVKKLLGFDESNKPLTEEFQAQD
jgi:exodeoxyribonuclease VII small subunit